MLPGKLAFDERLQLLFEHFSLLLQPCMRYVLELNNFGIQLSSLLAVALHVLSTWAGFEHVEDVRGRDRSHVSDPFDYLRRLGMVFFETR